MTPSKIVTYLFEAAIVAVAFIAIVRYFAKKDQDIADAANHLKEAIVESVQVEADGTKPSQAAIIRKAMAEQRRRENTEWTATNIQAHPELYLEHCRKLLMDYTSQYSAAVLETRTAINKNNRKCANYQAQITSLGGFMKLAQVALTNKDFSYPSKVGIYTYSDAKQLEDAVRKSDRHMTECEVEMSACKLRNEELSVVLKELEQDSSRVNAELSSMDSRIERAKAGNLKKHVEELRDRIDSLLGGMDALPISRDAAPIVGGVEKQQETTEQIFNRRNIK